MNFSSQQKNKLTYCLCLSVDRKVAVRPACIVQ